MMEVISVTGSVLLTGSRCISASTSVRQSFRCDTVLYDNGKVFDCEYVGFNLYAGGEWRDKFAG